MVGLERGRVGTLRLGARDGHGRQGRDPDRGSSPRAPTAPFSNRITPTSVPPSITKAPSRWATDPRASRKTGRSRSMPSAPSPAAPPTTTIAGLGPCSPMPERQPARSASRSTFTARRSASPEPHSKRCRHPRVPWVGKAGLLMAITTGPPGAVQPAMGGTPAPAPPDRRRRDVPSRTRPWAKARTRSRNRSDQVLQVARILLVASSTARFRMVAARRSSAVSDS